MAVPRRHRITPKAEPRRKTANDQAVGRVHSALQLSTGHDPQTNSFFHTPDTSMPADGDLVRPQNKKPAEAG